MAAFFVDHSITAVASNDEISVVTEVAVAARSSKTTYLLYANNLKTV